MPDPVSVSNGRGLVAYSKRVAAQATYAKGRAYIRAAMFLSRQYGYEDVVLHLLCRGIEVALKGLLLTIDYDQFKPRVTDLGRDLVRLVEQATAASGLKSPSPALLAELERLNNLYSVNIPRYGTSYDIVINPANIQSGRVMRRTAALVRLVERKTACAMSSARFNCGRYRTTPSAVRARDAV